MSKKKIGLKIQYGWACAWDKQRNMNKNRRKVERIEDHRKYVYRKSTCTFVVRSRWSMIQRNMRYLLYIYIYIKELREKIKNSCTLKQNKTTVKKKRNKDKRKNKC